MQKWRMVFERWLPLLSTFIYSNLANTSIWEGFQGHVLMVSGYLFKLYVTVLRKSEVLAWDRHLRHCAGSGPIFFVLCALECWMSTSLWSWPLGVFPRSWISVVMWCWLVNEDPSLWHVLIFLHLLYGKLEVLNIWLYWRQKCCFEYLIVSKGWRWAVCWYSGNGFYPFLEHWNSLHSGRLHCWNEYKSFQNISDPTFPFCA